MNALNINSPTPTHTPLQPMGAAAALREGIDAVADGAVQRAADGLASGMDRLRAQAAPALHDLAAGTEARARRSLQSLREHAAELRDSSVGRVREHPLQSVLIAAAAGAAVMLLADLLLRRGGTPR